MFFIKLVDGWIWTQILWFKKQLLSHVPFLIVKTTKIRSKNNETLKAFKIKQFYRTVGVLILNYFT